MIIDYWSRSGWQLQIADRGTQIGQPHGKEARGLRRKHDNERLRQLDLAHHLPAQSSYRLQHDLGGSHIITGASGCVIRDAEGRELLDGMAGLWCVNVGYGRQELVEAATAQMQELAYYNTFFRTATPPPVELVERVRCDVGPYLSTALERLSDHPIVGEVRSLGLIGAIEIIDGKGTNRRHAGGGVAGPRVRDLCIANGLMVRAIRDTIVMSPPLVITHEEIDQMVGIIRLALDQVAKEFSLG